MTIIFEVECGNLNIFPGNTIVRELFLRVIIKCNFVIPKQGT